MTISAVIFLEYI